jgi:hypothetical protein
MEKNGIAQQIIGAIPGVFVPNDYSDLMIPHLDV